MEALKGYQKKFLKGLAHGLKPVVFVGQKGMTANLIDSIQDALETHELIKVKFVELKDKLQKVRLVETLSVETNCQLVGMIGHMAILFRQQADPEKRNIQLPQR
ncbi:MAG: ribosome assembly RNA-binding protein YhbY [Desulfobacterales bacterium]|jgi:RNA-binding protein